MTKSLTLALAGTLSAIAFTPYAALAQLPSSFADDSGSPFCFMQTGDGQLLDLTQLCGSGRPLPTQAIAAPSGLSDPSLFPDDGLGSTSFERATRGNIIRPVSNGTPAFPRNSGVGSGNNSGSLGGNGASPCFIFDAQGRPCSP